MWESSQEGIRERAGENLKEFEIVVDTLNYHWVDKSQHRLENKMFNPNWIPLLVALNVSYCGAPGGSSGSSSDPYTFSCSEHSLMLNIEVDALSWCHTDSDCGQVLNGTGVGCSTDDRIANNSSNVSYFYDMLEEAEAAGCSVDFGTSGVCDPSAQPVCNFGECAWQ